MFRFGFMEKNKIIIISAVVVILAVAGIAAVVMLSNSDSDNVTYDGNGGITSDGETSFSCSNTTVIQNLFSNNGCAFTEWNTKSDGTGTAYSVGEAISYGTTLYAQWSYVVESYSMSRSNCNYFSFSIDDESLNMESLVSSGSKITVSEGSDWTLDDNVFTCTINGLDYSVVISISGTDSPDYSIVNDVPTVTLGTVSENITVSISCSRVY